MCVKGGIVFLSVRRVKGVHKKEKWPILPAKEKVINVSSWLARWYALTPHAKRDFIFPGRKVASHMSPSHIH